MQIDKNTVKHIAELCKLEVLEEEIDKNVAELNNILEYMSIINTMNTSFDFNDTDIINTVNVMRDDVVLPSTRCEELFKNTQGCACNTFVVPKTIE